MRFIGRENELAELQSVFEYAALRSSSMNQSHNNSSTLITIVAETGLGKSRIVQEFYNRLTLNQRWDPEYCNYWPNAFQTPQEHMHVNPIMQNHIAHGPPKFLWVGVRWMNPTERNGVLGGALHTIRDQLLVHAQFIQNNKTLWQRRLEKLLETTAEKANVQTLMSLIADNLIPFSGLAIEILSPMLAVKDSSFRTATEAHHERNTDLSEDLLRLFLETQKGETGIPIVLWLDDAQWMDDVSTRFMYALTRLAKQHRLPICIIATCWPREWHNLENGHFLRTNPTLELTHPNSSDLRTLLLEKFPGLSENSVTLILDKSHDNYLSLYENMGQLLTEPMYFLEANITNDLSPKGAKMVSGWEGSRLRRIKQRFTSLNSNTKKTLSRASVMGNAFFSSVIERYSRTHGIDDPKTLMAECVVPLTIVAEQGREFLEFRDRGYFTVAAAYFKDWLFDEESHLLNQALADELAHWIDTAYTPDAEFVEGADNRLFQLPLTDQLLILSFAAGFAQTLPALWLRATILACEVYANARLWDAVEQTTQSLAEYDWLEHSYSVVNLHPLEHLAMTAEASGNLDLALAICVSLLNEKKQRAATNPTQELQRDVTIGLNMLGNVYLSKGNLFEALNAYQEDVALCRLLLNDNPSVSNQRELSVILNKVGHIAIDNDDFDTAQNVYRESLSLINAVLDAEPSIEHRMDVTYNHMDCSLLYYLTGDIANAHTSLLKAIDVRKQVTAEQPSAEHYAALAFATDKLTRFVNDSAEHERILLQTLTYAEAAVTLRGALDDIALVAETCEAIANRAFDRGDLETAISYAHTACNYALRIAQSRSTGMDEYRVFNTETLAGYIELSRNNLPVCIDHFSTAMSAFSRIPVDNCTYEDFSKAVDTGLAYAMAQRTRNNTHTPSDFVQAQHFMRQAIDACADDADKAAATNLLHEFTKEALETDNTSIVLPFVGQMLTLLK